MTCSHNFTQSKSVRVAAGYEKIRHVSNMYIKKALFNAWLDDYKETRQAKRWFKRIKAGGGDENVDDDGDWCWPEGEDLLSLLPRVVAIKVCVH